MQRAGVAPPRGTPGRPTVEDSPAAPASAAGAHTPTTRSAASGASVVRRSSSLLDQVPASAFSRQPGGGGSAPGQALAVPPSGAVSRLGQSNGLEPDIRRSTGQVLRRNMTQQPVGNGSGNITDEFTPDDWDRIIERVVQKVEERVTDEQTRRGRIFDSNIF